LKKILIENAIPLESRSLHVKKLSERYISYKHKFHWEELLHSWCCHTSGIKYHCA